MSTETKNQEVVVTGISRAELDTILKQAMTAAVTTAVETSKAAHTCVFSEQRQTDLRFLSDRVHNGDKEKFDALLNFGGMLVEAKRTGIKITITSVIIGLVGLLIAGVRSYIPGVSIGPGQ